MNVLKSINELKKHLSLIRNGKMIKTGFVPTMGALHAGHLSLVQRAGNECDYMVCSIYVNPSQFNNRNDFINYPRNMEMDLKKLEKTQCHVVFTPDDEEMQNYPDLPEVELGYLDTVMEGAFRPGHFKGVSAIVSKLFDIIRPDFAYFGEKDYQQLLVVKHTSQRHKMNVAIKGCPTVRESDGLAMSSRNLLLSENERKQVSKIYQALCMVKNEAWKKPIKNAVEEAIFYMNSTGLLKPEYLTVTDSASLKTIKDWKETTESIACTAVYAGKIRLIDNIRIPH